MHILLVLAGNPPGAELLEASLLAADLSVGVDGGAESFRTHGLSPDLIIGDLDSLGEVSFFRSEIISLEDQLRTDLQKSLDYIIEKYEPKRITILGGTGGRTDHLLNNLQICTNIVSDLDISFVSDQLEHETFNVEELFRITPRTNSQMKVKVGSTVSLIQVGEFGELSIKGLEWDVQEVSSGDLFISQSNIALEDHLQVSLCTGCIYIAVYS